MKIGEIAAQDLQGIVGLLACSLAGMMPKSAKHLGPVKVVENSKFQQELDRFVADKPDEEALSFGAYNTITRAQSPSPKGLCQNLEFISILLKVFPTGRALPTFLQSSCIAVLDKYREKGRKFAGSFPHEQFARWFTKRCQVFLAHAREIGRNGFSEFQRSKISKAQADRIDAVCQPLAAHPHEGLSHDSLEEEDGGDEGEGMPAMDMAALLLDMWHPPAQRVTPKKKKAKTAHETPEKQDHGDDILKHAQKVAENRFRGAPWRSRRGLQAKLVAPKKLEVRQHIMRPHRLAGLACPTSSTRATSSSTPRRADGHLLRILRKL